MPEELLTYSQQDLQDLDSLMHDLAETSGCDEENLKITIADPNAHVLVIRDGGHIVATGTLCVKHTPEFASAEIESVVVSSQCRGKGYGKQLLTALIDTARQLKVRHIKLTSNPKRVAANKLYQALGFERYETNCYMKNIS